MTLNVTYDRGYGGFSLSADQLNQLGQLYQVQQKRFEDKVDELGLGTPMYQMILGFISDTVTTTTYGPAGSLITKTELVRKDGVDESVWQWIAGAVDINRAEGFYADFIRDYTKIQYKMRIGPPSGKEGDTEADQSAKAEELNQKASNMIALNLVSDLINYNGRLPDLKGLGAIDAGAAASSVFEKLGPIVGGDYAPWAGTLLFPFLGGDNFYRDLLLSRERVEADIQSGVDENGNPIYKKTVVKQLEGTYDLIAAMSASRAAAQSSARGNLRDAIMSLFAKLPGGDQKDLIKETTEFFNKYYGLGENDYKIGEQLLFDHYNFFEATFTGQNFIAGSYQDDKTLAGTFSDDIINAGLGDDTILASHGRDLIDGGDGIDTVDYRSLFADQRVVLDAGLAGDAAYKYKFKIEQSGFESDPDGNLQSMAVPNAQVFGVERLTLGGGSDTLKIDSLDASKLQGLEWIDMGGNSSRTGDVLDLRGMSEAVDIGRDGDGAAVLKSASSSANGLLVKGVETIRATAYADRIEGGGRADIIYAGDGDDEIVGGGGADRLYGQGGSDSLRGGEGADYLEGGAGNDSYYFSSADSSATDTIVDSDGAGRVIVDGEALSSDGFERVSDASWKRADGKFRVTKVENDGRTFLVISVVATGANIVINDWVDGALGLSFAANPTNPGDGWIEKTGGSGADALDTHAIDESQWVNHFDRRHRIGGGGGNDSISGGYLNDELDGGDGADYITGGAGADIIHGGDGNDFISESDMSVNWAPTVRVQREWGYEDVPTADYLAEMAAQYPDSFVARGAAWMLRSNGADKNDATSLYRSALLEGFAQNYYYNPDQRRDEGDYIDAGAGSDIVEAGGGADVVKGGTGNDVLAGGSDGDHISGDEGDDVIFGDRIRGSLDSYAPEIEVTGNDLLFGGAGNDKVYGQGGSDIISGGEGDDELYGDRYDNDPNATDAVREAPGDDVIDGGDGDDKIFGNAGGDTLRGGNGNDYIEGDDRVTAGAQHGDDDIDGGAGNDRIWGWGGSDTIVGGDGDDILVGDAATEDLALTFHGDDRLSGGAGRDQLMGGGGNDSLDGGEDDDLLAGDQGNDTLLGGAGNDKLQGGEGNDSLDGGTGNDLLAGQAGDDILFGGAGDDELQGGDGADALYGGDGADRLFGEAGNDLMDGGIGKDELFAGAGADTVLGGEGDDKLFGEAGDDVLAGGGGNDTIEGGEGRDTIDGGSGNDSAWGDAGDDQLLGGDGDDLLVGDDTGLAAAQHGKDYLDGGAGHDRLYGLGGDDTLNGGAGDDVLFGDDFERAFSGNDRLSGGDGADYVDGGAGNDVLSGDAGNDTLEGGDGDDLLIGGAGDDQLNGGRGNDRYSLESGFGHDRIVIGGNQPGSDRIEFGSGISASDLYYQNVGADLVITVTTTGDTVAIVGFFGPDADISLNFLDGTSLSYQQLRDQLNVAAPVIGQDTDDVIYGTEGADNIYGQGGNDTLYGSGGNDFLSGGSGNDTLTGGQGDDTLDGGAGNDAYVFHAGFGTDAVLGLEDSDSGADTIRFEFPYKGSNLRFGVGGPQDLVLLFDSFGGTDRLLLSGFMAAGSRHVVEFSDGVQLSFDGTELVYGYNGSLGGDDYRGTYRNDRMNGGAGNDTMYGWYGDDTLDGGDDNDDVNGGEGDDTLLGGAGNDLLRGEGGNDILIGGAGDDAMIGNRGSDTYRFERGFGNDSISNVDVNGDNGGGYDVVQFGQGIAPSEVLLRRVVEEGNGDNLVLSLADGSGTVTIKNYFADDGRSAYAVDEIRFADGTSWDMDAVKAAVLRSSDGDDTLVAFSSDDVVAGGNGNDTLDGAAGNDVLDGGAGDDVLIGGRGHDVYRFGRGSGQDSLVRVLPASHGEWGQEHYIAVLNELSEGIDVVEFGAGVAESDIALRRENNDLVLSIVGTDDVLRIPHYFGWSDDGNGGGDDGGGPPALAAARSMQDADGALANGYQDLTVEFFRFADGTVWDRERVASFLSANGKLATEGDDILYGDDGDADPGVLSGRGGNDVLYGTEGDDVIDGGAGDDILEGGQFRSGADVYGNDVMRGGTGNDTYRYDRGNDVIDNSVEAGQESGYDVVELDAYSDEVELERVGGDLLVRNVYDSSVLTVRDYFSRPEQAIAEIRFADGTAWTGADIAERAAGPGLVLQGSDNGESLSGYAGADVIHGGGGRDTLRGQVGDDRLFGEAGDDELFGGRGDDVLDGGAGDDSLDGGEGRNTYRFGIGYGNDYATDAGDGAVIEFAEGVTLSNLILQGLSYDQPGVSVRLRGGSDSLTLNGSMPVQLRFADGSVYGAEKIAELMRTSATEDNDTLIGGAGDDVLSSGLGRDYLYGAGGNDRLDGGAGDDTLLGGDGTDTYVFGRGYGMDQIRDQDDDSILQLGPDIAPDQIALVSKYYSDGHALRILGTDDVLQLDGQRLAQIRFADGTVWNREQIRSAFLATGSGNDDVLGFDTDDTLLGQAGDDRLYGGAGDDVLEGGAGRDFAYGGAGRDVYRFGRGSGEDNIGDSGPGELSVIELGSGISAQDLAFETDGWGLKVSIVGTEDVLYVGDFAFVDDAASGSTYEFAFADGTRWTAADVRARLLAGSAGDDRIVGFESGDRIDGGGGDDVIEGRNGNDRLYGDAGADRLLGGDGDDTLTGGDGNDALSGESGNDVLDGGSGNDELYGGYGNDTYRFGRGDGRDTVVYEWGYYRALDDVDTLQLKDGIAPADIVVSRSGYDLIVAISGGEDSVTIKDHFLADGETAMALDAIRFADGTVWTTAQIANRLASSTEAPDPDPEEDANGFDIRYNDHRFYTDLGSSEDDEMTTDARFKGVSGGAGNDRLFSGTYDDGLFGGAGDDYLQAGLYGSQLYGGSGWDSLYGSIATDYLYGGSGNDFLDGKGGDDELGGGRGHDTLFGGFGDDGLSGGEGNDKLWGDEGNDELEGGEGNDYLAGDEGDDTLLGGSGSDTFYFGVGFGRDRILSEGRWRQSEERRGEATTDTVSFGVGIAQDDIALRRDGRDLILSRRNSSDQLIIEEYFDASGAHDTFAIDVFRFDDGSQWGYEQVRQRLSTGGSGNDTIAGFAVDDVLSGLGGNDVLSGLDGNDRLEGGDGDDLLSGDAGNDALVGGSGNDALFGGAGSDSYLFDRGFGHDRISDYVDAGAAGDIDEIVFGAGISATELQLSRIGDDLRVALGDGTDAVTVASYFVSHSQGSLPNAIERIRFADGTVWNQDDVAAAVGGTPANAAPPAQAASAAYAPEADKPMSWREWSAHQPSETVVRRELQSLIVAMGQPLAVAPATRDAQADSTAGLLGVASGFAEFEHTQRSAGGLVL